MRRICPLPRGEEESGSVLIGQRYSRPFTEEEPEERKGKGPTMTHRVSNVTGAWSIRKKKGGGGFEAFLPFIRSKGKGGEVKKKKSAAPTLHSG